MGRPPKPTAQLRLHGGYRDHRHGNRADEVLADGKPAMPSGLDDGAKLAWNAIVSNLPEGVLAKVDVLMLEGAARWFSRWKELQQKPADDYRGLVMAACAWKQFVAVACRFGMSPADRAKLAIEQQDDDVLTAPPVPTRKQG